MPLRGLAPEEQTRVILSVGTHRSSRPYSPIEVAKHLKRAADAGMSRSEIGEAIHAKSMVGDFIRLLRLDPDVQHLVDWKSSDATVAFTAASELTRLPTSEHKSAFEGILINGFSTEEAKQLVQLRLRSGRPITECVKDILRLRHHVIRHHLFIGEVTSAELREHLASLTQSQRDDLLRRSVRISFPSVGAFAGRLGAERFTISGDDALAAQLKSGSVDFETSINQSLASQLGKDDGLSD